MLIAAIDLGTTGARAIVYDENLRPLAESYTEYPLIAVSDTMVEQDAELWWRLSCGAVKKAVAASGASAGEVRAVGISSQGISVVPVSENFAPLRNAISWLDRRATPQLQHILQKVDARRLYNITGKLPSAAYTLPKLMWLAENEPQTMQKCRYLLLPHDFLAARLTGKAVAEHTLASGTMLYDLQSEGWSAQLAEMFGIPTDKLPAIVRGGDAIGPLTPQAALEMGLTERAMVYAGGQDQKCASLAAGLEAGVATVSLGTATAIEMQGKPRYDAQIPAFAYFAKGETVLEGVIPASGMSLRWLRDLLLPAGSYDALTELAKPRVSRTKAMFFPYLSGEGSPGWDTATSARFHGLTQDTATGDLVCAVLEGVAFEIARNLSAMEGATRIRAFGGGAKSDVWRQIIADVTGLPVEAMETHETACMGAAMLAARGAGLEAGFSRAKTIAVNEPIPELSGYYRDKFHLYMNLYQINHSERNTQ